MVLNILTYLGDDWLACLCSALLSDAPPQLFFGMSRNAPLRCVTFQKTTAEETTYLLAPRETVSLHGFSDTLIVLRGEGRRNTKLSIPRGASVRYYNSKLKNGKQKLRKIVCLTPTDTEICSSFKEHYLITCEWKVLVVVSSLWSEF